MPVAVGSWQLPRLMPHVLSEPNHRNMKMRSACYRQSPRHIPYTLHVHAFAQKGHAEGVKAIRKDSP